VSRRLVEREERPAPQGCGSERGDQHGNHGGILLSFLNDFRLTDRGSGEAQLSIAETHITCERKAADPSDGERSGRSHASTAVEEAPDETRDHPALDPAGSPDISFNPDRGMI
jgi:hypothetical protein